MRNDNFGQLYLNSELICYTIDPHKLTSGVYNLQLNQSPKFKKELPLIYNDCFPANRGFRIHSRKYSKG